MPANLPPDYYAAEKRYRQAETYEQKIECLREMLAIMPKHKGTEHLQGDLKRKIAKLNSQSQKKHVKAKSAGLDHIPNEGAGQAVLVGAPNTGKSSLLNYFTNAKSEVAEFPFSTYRPVCGMMPFEDIGIQLVDIPPISPNYRESWMFNIIRMADVVLLLADLSDPKSKSQLQEVIQILENHHILLKKNGESRPQGQIAVKTTLFVGTKSDEKDNAIDEGALRNLLDPSIPFLNVSLLKEDQLDVFKRSIFLSMDIIRVYTKIPGKPADYEKPYLLKHGATVQEAAEIIHKELSDSMTFARIWGSEKYDGQRVERDHKLEDRDVIEIHTK